MLRRWLVCAWLVLASSVASAAEYRITDYGADCDDLLDDTAAIQAAVDAAAQAGGGVVIFPSGTCFVVEATDPGGSGNPRAAIYLTTGGFDRSKVHLRGEGVETTVVKVAAGTYTGDFFTFLIGSVQDVSIRDITVDGNRLEITADEQTHAIQIEGAQRVRLTALRFRNTKGDGVKLVGAAATAKDILISDSTFEDLGRSGITFQIGVQEATVSNNLFHLFADQAIDLEPSGTPLPEAIVMSGNQIGMCPDLRGNVGSGVALLPTG